MRKTWALLAAWVGLTGCALLQRPPPEGIPAPPAGHEWNLIWGDEFDGVVLDPQKWAAIGDMPRRDGYWSRSDTRLDREGHLVLRTRRADGRDGTEIDIVEKLSTASEVSHFLHWDGYGEAHQAVGKRVRNGGLNEGFHTFAVYWTPTEYVFYVNGRETWRTAAGGVSQVPQHILITDEVGELAGNIDEATLPDEFVVDWVRVYEAKPRHEQ